MRHSAIAVLVIGLGGSTAVADTARWTGPYAGATLGYASGTATGVGPATSTRVCNVGGTRYDLAGSLYTSGSFLISQVEPGLPADISHLINIGYGFDADGLGLVPIGDPFDFEFRGQPRGIGNSVPVLVSVQALGYGAAGIRALVDERTTIPDPVTFLPVDNPFDCLILNTVTAHNRAIGPYPVGTVAFELPSGTQIVAWTDDPEPETGGVFEDVAGAGAGTETGLDGTLLGGLAGHTWAMPGGGLISAEGRLLIGDIAGGAVSAQNLAILGGRVGGVVGNTYLFGSVGLAFSEITVGGDGGMQSGLALGLGAETAVTDRLSIRGDATWVDFGEDTYAGVGAVGVDALVASVTVVMRF
jgi:opacity protein-like surface antigen